MPLTFQEAILIVCFLSSDVLQSAFTSVGNEVSTSSGKLSTLCSFFALGFFPFPRLPLGSASALNDKLYFYICLQV